MKKNDIKNFLKLNDTRKMFLIVWIPITIIVFVIIAGTYIGEGKFKQIGETVDGQAIWADRTIADEILLYLILFLFSFIMYIIAGIEEIKPYEKVEIND